MTSTRAKSTRQHKDSAINKNNNGQNTRKPVLNRPKKRSIVRWNDTLNNKLLLCIQSACNSLGVKLPLDEVAELMGGSISEGAITQHLSKLRTKMEAGGHAVPPLVKRGGASTALLGGGSASASASASANHTQKPKRSTAAMPTRNKMEVEGSSDDDEDSDDSDRYSVAAFAGYQNRDGSQGNNDDKGDLDADADGDADIDKDKDNRSENGSEYIAAGASFLQFPNDPSPGLASNYNHKQKTQTQPQAKSNAKPRAKANANARGLSHPTTTSSGSSPRQKIVKLRIPKGGRVNGHDGNGSVGYNSNGNENGNVDALGHRLSDQNISSPSSQAMHSSPVDMEMGRNTQNMMHEAGAVGYIHQQHNQHGKSSRPLSQYGWAGLTSRSPHASQAEILRPGGHHIDHGSHTHNHNHMSVITGFPQRADPFDMGSNGMGMLHSPTANSCRFSPPGYQENMHMFPKKGMPPPPQQLSYNPPISAQGYSAGGMWHNNNPNLHGHTVPGAYHTDANIANNQGPHPPTTHYHEHEHDTCTYTTSSTPTLPYQHITHAAERRTSVGENNNLPPSAPTAAEEHPQQQQMPDQEQHGPGQMDKATTPETQTAMMNELGDLPHLDPSLNNFDMEFDSMGGGHVEGLFTAYEFGMDGVFNNWV
ncbi:hypothetical protein ACJ72_04338 [Emergomyces africanus]|uniref:Uncharacterized protein n=1 Tax=Emergomyces africanus TaxID=1955775 RepID=A0A1B7NX28_9EURO|nr:hypothetical protein ACJ72_04338 [Emergomyces africanus]